MPEIVDLYRIIVLHCFQVFVSSEKLNEGLNAQQKAKSESSQLLDVRSMILGVREYFQKVIQTKTQQMSKYLRYHATEHNYITLS